MICPTADPKKAAENFPRWRAMGYKIAALVDDKKYVGTDEVNAVIHPAEPYAGYPWAIRQILVACPDINLFVAAADDMHPDPTLRAEQIAEQFFAHFPDGIGVMQPTGDPFMTDAQGRSAAARICGSPWMTRSFAMRLYRGTGPFHPGFQHLWADEDLQNVAIKHGWLWQRGDLTQYHDHYTRRGDKRPSQMVIASTCHRHDEALFRERQAAGFPDSELSE